MFTVKAITFNLGISWIQTGETAFDKSTALQNKLARDEIH